MNTVSTFWTSALTLLHTGKQNQFIIQDDSKTVDVSLASSCAVLRPAYPTTLSGATRVSQRRRTSRFIANSGQAQLVAISHGNRYDRKINISQSDDRCTGAIWERK